MNKEELLSLAATCGHQPGLIRKIMKKENKANKSEAADLLKSMLSEFGLTKDQLITAYNPEKRAKILEAKAKNADAAAVEAKQAAAIKKRGQKRKARLAKKKAAAPSV